MLQSGMMNESKSKSQKKREAVGLRDIGAELVALSLDKLDKLPLPIRLRQAILEAKALKSYGAIRRQSLWIGKMMRVDGAEEIVAAYEQLLAEDSAQTAAFHDVEVWRTRLINEGKEALTLFVEACPAVDVQQLRQLIKKAADEQHRALHTGAGRALFRYLRSFIA